MSSPTFDRLIRFQTSDGAERYGNLEKETPTREIEGSEVELLDGDIKSGFKKAGGKAKVGKLLCPLKREELNIVLCVGLNYKRHAEECNVSYNLFVSSVLLEESRRKILLVRLLRSIGKLRKFSDRMVLCKDDNRGLT
jgi:hypothetical protein